MKRKSFHIIALFVISLIMVSCSNQEKKAKKSQNETTTDKVAEKPQIDEFNLLLSHLEENGNFINSEFCPSMISSKNVYENMKNPAYHIIDIRKPVHYAEGHIQNAVNVKFFDVLDYFKNKITPNDYEKIILVCYSGQSASYLTSLLNMLGYDNVYAMKFGMSSWDKNVAKSKWLKNISDKYIDKLETKENPKNTPGEYPKLYTGEKDGKSILLKQAENIVKDPFKARLVSADEVFNNPEKYYIVNYWPKEKYDAGHIPGAVQYTPKKSLSSDTYLNTLPTDKPVVIYCYTGQHASHVAAYLNLLGYDARVLKYGANSFMHSKLVKNKWHPFTAKKIHNYPVVKAGVAVQ